MNRLHQLLHLGFDVVDNHFHGAGPVNNDHHVQAFSAKLADESAEARADAVTVARAHPAAATDSDTATAASGNVVAGETCGLGGADGSRLLHLLRCRVGHRHFGHIEILHLVAAATAAACFEVHHDQLAATLFVHRDDQEEQGEDVKGDR